MPHPFANLTEEELTNHPAIEATAAFLVRAILEGRVKPQASSETNTVPQIQPKQAQRRTSSPRRKGASS